MMVIRKSVEADFAEILAIVNAAAHAYRGVIPVDRWHEPYMPSDELAGEINRGVVSAMWKGSSEKPILIGTWAAASWAIEFYRRNGFTLVPNREKDRLLRTYWSIPARQIETSVVLADRRWRETQPLYNRTGDLREQPC